MGKEELIQRYLLPNSGVLEAALKILGGWDWVGGEEQTEAHCPSPLEGASSDLTILD